MSECIAFLTPGIMGASLLQSGMGIATNHGPEQTLQRCPNTPSPRPDPTARKLADDSLICKVACCCLSTPSTGSDNRELMQACVEQSFKNADRMLGHNSRYKPELSFNMQDKPPSPFMHRNPLGQNTTEPSRYWQGRAQHEIENYRSGRGMVRRPDLVIVNDPCLPPEQGNIERVVEIKFKDDARDSEQDNAYRKIAGHTKNYSIFRVGAPPVSNEQGCDCEQRLKPQPIPVPVTQANKDSEQQTIGNALTWSSITALGGLATAALFLLPLDGPAGEIAAGSATAAAAQRAASAWKALGYAF